MQCPKCQSSDVIRSRRRFWERIALFALRAQVFRCRDCKKRFWAGIEWGKVILGSLTAVVVTGVIVTMVVVYRNQQPPVQAPSKKSLRKRRRLPPMPKGLPPLSSVPLPAAGDGGTSTGTAKESR